MKKILVSILILSLFLFTEGCSSLQVEKSEPIKTQTSKELPVIPSTEETPKTDLPKSTESPSAVAPDKTENITTPVEKKIVEIGDDGASCSVTKIQDTKGNNIPTPKEVTDDLQCQTSNSFSPNWNLLTFQTWNEKTNKRFFKIYNFTTKQSEKILELLQNNEAFGCSFRDDGKFLACLAVNQSTYTESGKYSATKFFIMQISEDGKLLEKKVYPLKHEVTADYVCGAGCYPGKFWFEGEHTLKYEGHNAIEETAGKVFGVGY